jgi:hypothetical protein
MQYNESEYNGDSYNLTNYTQTLSETITDSDATVAFSVSIVKTDSQGSADALSDGVSLAAMLDTITILQRAKTPFAYNNGRYNDYMYNARADEDEILLAPTKVLVESLSSTDFMQPFIIAKVITELITDVDILAFSGIHVLNDFIFLSEYFRIEITNKALNDTIRLADWLSIERTPVNNEWAD